MSQTATQQLDPVLRDKVRMLGSLLGQTISDQYGQAMLEQIEQIRQQAKKARSGASAERDTLLQLLQNLPALHVREFVVGSFAARDRDGVFTGG